MTLTCFQTDVSKFSLLLDDKFTSRLLCFVVIGSFFVEFLLGLRYLLLLLLKLLQQLRVVR